MYGPLEGRERGRSQDNPDGDGGTGHPLIGLVLDADEVVVGKTVGFRMVPSFDRSFPVPHHEIEDGNYATEGG